MTNKLLIFCVLVGLTSCETQENQANLCIKKEDKNRVGLDFIKIEKDSTIPFFIFGIKTDIFSNKSFKVYTLHKFCKEALREKYYCVVYEDVSGFFFDLCLNGVWRTVCNRTENDEVVEIPNNKTLTIGAKTCRHIISPCSD